MSGKGLTAILFLLLSSLAILSYLPSFATPSPSPSGRTYVLWTSQLPYDDHICYVEVIPDIDLDGIRDVFVITRSSENCTLYYVNGLNGKITLNRSESDFQLRPHWFCDFYMENMEYCGPVILSDDTCLFYDKETSSSLCAGLFAWWDAYFRYVSSSSDEEASLCYSDGIYKLVYDNWWEVSFSGITVFGVVSASKETVIYACDDGSALNVTRYNLVQNALEYSKRFTDVWADFYAMPLRCRDPGYFYLLIHNSSGLAIRKLDETIFSRYYDLPIDNIFEVLNDRIVRVNAPIFVDDLDGDWYGEFFAVKQGKWTLFSGSNGTIFQQFDIAPSEFDHLYAEYGAVHPIASLGDVDHDSRFEYAISYAEGGKDKLALYSVSPHDRKLRWVVSVDDLPGVQRMQGAYAMDDLDGDGVPEVLTWDSQSRTLICLWGSWDNEPPACVQHSPSNGWLTNNSSLTIRVDAFDRDSGLDKVQVCFDGTWYDAAYNSTADCWEVALRDVGEGEHWWFAKAVDKVGYSTSTGNWTLTVDLTPPSVEVTSPINGSTLYADYVTVEWDSSDNVGLDHYEVRVNGSDWLDVGKAENFTFACEEGLYTVEVKAVDLAGNERVDSVTFEVRRPKEVFPWSFAIGLILAAVIIAVAVGAYVVYRKRRTPPRA